MKNGKQWAQVAVAAIFAAGIGINSQVVVADDEKPKEEAMEKCYGIAKKGMNECAAESHSCQGGATVDNDPNEWILVPAGTCKKLGGKKK